MLPSTRARSLKSSTLAKFHQIRHFRRIHCFHRIRRFRASLLSSSFPQNFDFGEISPNSSFSSLHAFLDISQNHQKDPRPLNTEWSYLKMPYVSKCLNYKITNIFQKEGIPVRVTHKSYTFRRALSPHNMERTCTRANCPISNTKLCLLRNVVYQITCNNCNQHYIGSTTRFVHDQVREHLNNDNSSVR